MGFGDAIQIYDFNSQSEIVLTSLYVSVYIPNKMMRAGRGLMFDPNQYELWNGALGRRKKRETSRNCEEQCQHLLHGTNTEKQHTKCMRDCLD